MPTYQYACTACGHELEAVQSFTDDPLTQCPACEGRLRKLYGSVGVVFKGPGFYRTDSRAGANGSGKEAAKESGTEQAAGAGKNADADGSGGSTGVATKDGKSADTKKGDVAKKGDGDKKGDGKAPVAATTGSTT